MSVIAWWKWLMDQPVRSVPGMLATLAVIGGLYGLSFWLAGWQIRRARRRDW